MGRNIITAVLIVFLALGAGDNSYAAPEKKKGARKQTTSSNKPTAAEERYNRKEERRMRREERKKQKQERKLKRYASKYGKTKPVASHPAAFKYPPTVRKDHYRVDIYAAIYLDELVQSRSANLLEKIPDRALPGVSFYEGVTIAADSLKRAGFNFDIYVHDAMSATESPESMIKSGALDSADLIIASLPAEYLPSLAEHAKKKKINFVSTLIPTDGGIKGNKYFTMLNPSLRSHCDWILDDVSRKFPGMKVSLLYRTTNETDERAYRNLVDAGKLNFRRMNCATLPSKDEFSRLFDTTKPNVVVIPILSPAYGDSLMQELTRDFPSTHFEVYGMPTWSSISGLRKDDAYPNLSVNVTTAHNIDAGNPIAKYVARTYKSMYGGKASESVFRGYEVTFWYANLLRSYGTIFNTNYADNTFAPFTKYEVAQRWDEDGQTLYSENKHLYLSKYEGGACKTQ